MNGVVSVSVKYMNTKKYINEWSGVCISKNYPKGAEF